MKLLKPQDFSNPERGKNHVSFYDYKFVLSRSLSRAVKNWSHLAFYQSETGELIVKNDSVGFEIRRNKEGEVNLYRKDFCDFVRKEYGFVKYPSKCVANFDGETITIITREL